MQGLRKMRKDGRWRAEEIAVAAGVTASAVYSWEKGSRYPRKPQMEKLCKFFNCKIDDLM